MTEKHRPALAPVCFRKLKGVDPELGKVTGELIKAYGAGATLDELRETFMLIPWNFGVSYFCSEVSTGTPMRAFELIVAAEEAGLAREEVVERLKTRLRSQIGFEGEGEGNQ